MVLPSVMNQTINAFRKLPKFDAAKQKVINESSYDEVKKAAERACKLNGLPPEYAQKAIDELYSGKMAEEIKAIDKQIEELKAKKLSLEKEKASVDTVVTVIVMLLVAAILTPVALSLLAGANTSGWNATNVTIFGLLGTIAMVAIILKFLRQVKET